VSRRQKADAEKRRERDRRRRQADPARARAADRRKRLANPEAAHERERRYLDAHPEARERRRQRARRYRQENPEPIRERGRQMRQAARDAVLDHYGRVCACPGCGATEDLVIDHVNGDGKAHRIKVFGITDSGSYRMYRWLIRNGFPEDFQVLCNRCNSSKNNGPACRLNHAV
jgi:hypothetical protein